MSVPLVSANDYRLIVVVLFLFFFVGAGDVCATAFTFAWYSSH